ncbi:hypothetical protein [Rossellomorea aquimaris]|uniref:hypothetical protein n=1 Tax=Rossellomorea aquimaris TaxID=189382 RepID=UPI000AEADC49|nr:hypothetical protein [Rossellomorea aquimaris]
MKKWWFLIGIVSVFIFLHLSPILALRTHLFLTGYPKTALTSGIIDDEYHNQVDKEKFELLSAKAYTLTEPPIEKETDGELRNYLVKKVFFLYFAEYYGEG